MDTSISIKTVINFGWKHIFLKRPDNSINNTNFFNSQCAESDNSLYNKFLEDAKLVLCNETQKVEQIFTIRLVNM